MNALFVHCEDKISKAKSTDSRFCFGCQFRILFSLWKLCKNSASINCS